LIVVVMGVTGAGKTTIGELLASQLGWHFADADQFHPKSNVEKMSQGVALTDADRAPWLSAMRSAIQQWISQNRSAVLACSALKQAYRDELKVGPDVRFVYLRGNYDVVAEQLRMRHGHFATETILADQFATLEEPKDAIVIDVGRDPESMVAQIRAQLGLS
jgi:gluconokinase